MELYTLPADVRSWELFPAKDQQKKTYLVGSVALDKYIVVPAEQHTVVCQILDLIQEGHTPEQIRSVLLERGIQADVQAFCQRLAEKGLLQGGASPAPMPSKWWFSLFAHLRALSWEVFSISLDPLQKPLNKVAFWFSLLLLMGVLISTGAVIISGQFRWELLRELAYSARRGYNFLWMLGINIAVVPFSVLFHEMTHAIIAARGHIYPKRLSLRWFLTIPYFSLQVPGLYTLPFGQRLLAIAGGPLADLLAANITFLTARATDIPWLWLMAVLNYSRFFFNSLPILPMTDGYALLSQGLFREIDVRGRAVHEFRRWRQRKPNRFRGKYVFFYAFNTGVGLFILLSGLWQLDTIAAAYIRLIWPSLPGWVLYGILGGIDLLCIYLLRNRLRILLAW